MPSTPNSTDVEQKTRPGRLCARRGFYCVRLLPAFRNAALHDRNNMPDIVCAIALQPLVDDRRQAADKECHHIFPVPGRNSVTFRDRCQHHQQDHSAHRDIEQKQQPRGPAFAARLPLRYPWARIRLLYGSRFVSGSAGKKRADGKKTACHRYLPVILMPLFFISCGVPHATICPPASPPPGPMSIT